MGSIADIVKEREARLAEQQAQRDKLQQDITSAREAKGSFVSNWLKQNKPTYDANAEKRQKQAARIKAIGDAMGLVASGFAAFGKNGVGYVPKFTSTAVADIEKINEARKTFAERDAAWKDFEYKTKTSELEAREKAAQALKDAKDKEILRSEEALAKLQAEDRKYKAAAETAEKKAQADKEKQERTFANQKELEGIKHANQKTLEGIRQSNRLALEKAKASKEDTTEDVDILVDYYLSGNPTKESTTTRTGADGRTTSVTSKPIHITDLDKKDKEVIAKQLEGMPDAELYRKYRKEGDNSDTAKQKVERVKNHVDKRIKDRHSYIPEADMYEVAEEILRLMDEEGMSESQAESLVLESYEN